MKKETSLLNCGFFVVLVLLFSELDSFELSVVFLLFGFSLVIVSFSVSVELFSFSSIISSSTSSNLG